MRPDKIGGRLRRLRGDRTLEEVANATKSSVSALSMYEHGERVPRDPMKQVLANYYRVSVEELFYCD